MSSSTGADTPVAGIPVVRPAAAADVPRTDLGPRPATRRRAALALCSAYLLMTGAVLLLWWFQP